MLAESKDTLCSTISNWFDDRSVDTSQYPDKYTKAIETQTAIGWHHIFMGHFSVEWSNAQDPFKSPSGTPREAYTRGASVKAVSLKWFLDLWEARNNDIHGHTESKQNRTYQTKGSTPDHSPPPHGASTPSLTE